MIIRMVKNYLISMFMFTTTFKGCYIRRIGETVLLIRLAETKSTRALLALLRQRTVVPSPDQDTRDSALFQYICNVGK